MPPPSQTHLFLFLLALATQKAKETRNKRLCNKTIKIIETMLSDFRRAGVSPPHKIDTALYRTYADLLELRTELDFT